MNAYQIILLNKIVNINHALKISQGSYHPSKEIMVLKLKELTNELREQIGDKAYYLLIFNLFTLN